ncbi:MAG: glycosyltransferase family 4 protein [Pseudomonadota bacterium]
MRIMSLMNVTNGDRCGADSGWIFNNLIAEEFIRAGHEFIFVGPTPLKEGLGTNVPYDFGGNKYSIRFDFNLDDFIRIINEHDPDVILANQLEIVPQLRAASTLGPNRAKIFGYAHYIPWWSEPDKPMVTDPSQNTNGISRLVVNAFMNGVDECDGVFTHSETSQNFLRLGFQTFGRTIKTPLGMVPPPYDPFLNETTDHTHSSGAVTALYGHRLYQHYGSEYFANEIAPRLTELGINVRVMDVLGKRSEERRKLDPYPEQIRDRLAQIEGVEICTSGCKRKNYRDSIQESTFGIAPLRPGTPWSMSCIDMMAAGKPMIAPNISWYAEALPENLRFNPDKPDEIQGIALRLMENPSFYTEMSRECLERTRNLAPSNIAGTMLTNFAMSTGMGQFAIMRSVKTKSCKKYAK